MTGTTISRPAYMIATGVPQGRRLCATPYRSGVSVWPQAVCLPKKPGPK
jgi:hypothetical protein